MKRFDVKPTIKWDAAFWRDDFPHIRLERLTELLQDASNKYDLEQIKTIFFTPLTDNGPMGITRIFGRMDNTTSDTAITEALMRLIFSNILKPRYFPIDSMDKCRAMLVNTLPRRISALLKIECLNDIWEQIVAIEDVQARMDSADLFLAEISEHRNASTLITGVIRSPLLAGKTESTFLEFLLSPTVTEITRFERSLHLFDANDLMVFQLVDPGVIKKMFIDAKSDKKCPVILRQVIVFSQGKIELGSALWKHVVEPHEDSEPVVATAFIDGLFTYMADGKYGPSKLWLDLLTHLILTLPYFESSLLASNCLGLGSVELIAGLTIPDAHRMKFYVHILNGADRSNALNILLFFQKLAARRVNPVMLLPESDMSILLQLIWSQITDSHRLDFYKSVFLDRVWDDHFSVNTHLIKSLLHAAPTFKEYLLSLTLQNKTFNYHRSHRGIHAHLNLFIDSDLDVAKRLTPLLIEHIPNVLFELFKNIPSNEALFEQLKQIHPYLINQPKFKQLILSRLNQFLQPGENVVENEKRTKLLNDMATDRALCWFLLTYAYEIPASEVSNLHQDYGFLLKFRSLDTLSSFSEDAEHIQIHYPKAEHSLIGLINRTKVTKVTSLTLDPIMRWGQRVGVQNYIAPHFEYGGFFYSTPSSQRRIEKGVTALEPESRKKYAELHPDPFIVPYAICDAINEEADYLVEATAPCVQVLDEYIQVSDRKPAADQKPASTEETLVANLVVEEMPAAPTGNIVLFPAVPQTTTAYATASNVLRPL